MKTYPVKVITERHPFTPRLDKGKATALLPLLKAVLVTGIGETGISKLSVDREKSLIKAEFNSGHGFSVGDVLEINNATDAIYNREVKIIEATETFLWFDVETLALSDDTSATAKLAPFGWSIAFENPENTIAIFKPNDATCEVYLRVDNSQFSGWKPSSSLASFAKVQMITDVVSIEDFTLLGESKLFNSIGESKDNTAITLKKFILIGGDKFFYFLSHHNSNVDTANRVTYNTEFCGVFESNVPQDTLNFLLSGSSYPSSNGTSQLSASTIHKSFSNTNNFIAGNYLRKQGAVGWSRIGSGTYPYKLLGAINKVDNSISFDMSKVGIMEDGEILRGYLPIIVTPLCYSLDLLNKEVTVSGRNILSLYSYSGPSMYYDANASSYVATCGYDVTPVEA